MGMLKNAFNAVTRLNSQAGYVKRLGSPDIYSPMRMTASNYFRYLAGPSQTVVTGSECIIPLATLLGQPYLIITVDHIPTLGTFKLSLTVDGASPVTTADIDFDADGSDIQMAVRLLTGCENVTVVGDLQSSSLRILFVGNKTLNAASVDISSLVTTTVVTAQLSSKAWDVPTVRRGDRILNTAGTLFMVTEVVDMPDLGGEIIGLRVRYE